VPTRGDMPASSLKSLVASGGLVDRAFSARLAPLVILQLQKLFQLVDLTDKLVRFPLIDFCDGGVAMAVQPGCYLVCPIALRGFLKKLPPFVGLSMGHARQSRLTQKVGQEQITLKVANLLLPQR
jgi:hypothetical protein